MRQLDELLDEILRVPEERTDEGEAGSVAEAAAPETEEPTANGWSEGNGHEGLEVSETWADPSEQWAESPAAPESSEWTAAAVDATVEAPVEVPWTETYAEASEHPAETYAEEPAETYAEYPAETYAEPYAPPAETYAEYPAETYAEEYPAEAHAETYAETYAEEHQPETYADEGYPEQPQPEAYEPQQWAAQADTTTDEGQSVEEALADSWDGSLDLADPGWDAQAQATEPPPAMPPPPLAYEWRAVEAAAAAPVVSEPEAFPQPPEESAPEIVAEPFSDLWTAGTAPAEAEAPARPPAWIEVPVSSPTRAPDPAVAPAEVSAPAKVPAPAGSDVRGSRPRRSAPRRARRAVGVAGLVLALAVASLWTITALRGGPALRPAPPAAGALDQRVVTWSVWDEKPGGPAFVTVFATGGGLDPVLLAIPPKTMVTVPGSGLKTIGDAAGVGEPEVVAAAVENILGVRVDDSTGMPLASLAPLVDRIGGIEVDEDVDIVEQVLDGEQTVEYLRATSIGEGEPGDDTRFIRWLEVSTAIVTKAHERPDVLEEISEELRPVFAAAGGGRTEVIDLPVEAIGAGLARPDGEKVAQVARDYFVATAQTDGVVRIVVMNGNGRPGVGQHVARLLVPSGFRLVSSLNAPKFNVETTRIVAGSEEFLEEAYLAQRLIGVGEVYIVDQASHVADISIVVGKDFLKR